MKKTFDEEAFVRVCEGGKKYFDRQNENIKDPRGSQMDFLMKLLQDNKDTEFGRLHGFADIETYEEFRDAVPLSEYNDYQDYINRMIDDREKDLLSVNPVVHYAASSGSTGVPKRIPVTQQGKEFFAGYGGDLILYHLYEQIRKQGHKPGPICFLADFHWDTLFDDVTFGSISAHMAYNFRDDLEAIATSPYALQHLHEPSTDAPYAKAVFALKEKNLSFIFGTFSSAVYEFLHLIETNWKRLVHDIRVGKLDPELSISDKLRTELEACLEPDPVRADELEAEFTKGFDKPFVPRIWPNMSMFCCIGGSFFAEYTRKLRVYAPDTPIHMGVYGASESQIAVPLACDDTEYSPLAEGIFFEFRAVDGDDEGQIYLLDELKPGKDYEVIITNMSGFYRYRMMDVMRIDSLLGKSPKGHIAYRLNQVVSMVGEKTTTEDLDTVVSRIGEEVGSNITEFALYADYSTTPARYILLMEPDEYLGKGDQKELGPVADGFFREANRSFNKYREQNTIGTPLITYLEPGSFRLYKELQIASGISANQVKPVKVIDNQKKAKFFFGLSEGPYKAMRRVLFDVEQKLLEMDQLERENAKMKLEIAALKKELEAVQKSGQVGK